MSEELQANPEATRRQKAKTRLMLVVAWLWVGVPLAWGVLQTVRKSLALFW